MTLNEYNLLTSSCWNEKYHPLTIGMIKSHFFWQTSFEIEFFIRSRIKTFSKFLYENFYMIDPNVAREDMFF